MKQPDSHQSFALFLQQNESWLMQRLLVYAENNDYTKYTSTLIEAWRVSIEGLTNSLISMMQQSPDIPELHPDDDYVDDPAAQFGIIEANKHRQRGVNLAMFLSLMKYYRQSYHDLVHEELPQKEHRYFYHRYLDRFFDRTEIAYSTEWAGLDAELQIQQLSNKNLLMANEKNLYITIFDSFASPVVLFDSKGYVTNANKIAASLFLGIETSGGFYYKEHREPQRLSWFDKELQHFISDSEEEMCHFEKRFVDSNGTEMLFDVRIKRIPDISKKFVGYTAILNDITRLRVAERQVLVSERMAALGMLAAGVAHEINNPVAFVDSNLHTLQEYAEQIALFADQCKELLQQNGDPQLQQQWQSVWQKSEMEYLQQDLPQLVSESLEGTERVRKIVTDLKSFARLDNDVSESFNVEEGLQSTLNIVHNELKYKAEVTVDFGGVPAIEVAGSQINQVFMNILVNAAQAIERKGTIHLQTRHDDNWVYVLISDTGCGMSKEVQEKLFQPFFTTKAVGKGTGLGLSVSYGIIDKHGGKIEVESQEGKGTTFTILLPLHRSSK